MILSLHCGLRISRNDYCKEDRNKDIISYIYSAISRTDFINQLLILLSTPSEYNNNDLDGQKKTVRSTSVALVLNNFSQQLMAQVRIITARKTETQTSHIYSATSRTDFTNHLLILSTLSEYNNNDLDVQKKPLCCRF